MTTQQTEDYENSLKTAFFAIRNLRDPANKISPIAGQLMELIVEAQNGTIEEGGQQ